MNKRNTILPAIISIFFHAITFSMDQSKHQNGIIPKLTDKLPLFDFYPVSDRNDLLQNRMPNKNDGLLPYPHLFNDFIEKEPRCIDWYKTLFGEIAQRNIDHLIMHNISPDNLNRYLRRLRAEKELTITIAESASANIHHPSTLPVLFHPQFHTVTTNEELLFAVFQSNHGFYFYPRPAHKFIDARMLANVYRASLKINIDRAHYMELDNKCIDTYIKIILALSERYQYDLEQAIS